MYRLVIISGKLKDKRITVQQGTVLIGRGPGCQLDLEGDSLVAARHAAIEDRSGGPVIRGLEAGFLVNINGFPVTEHRLRHGDRITLGETVLEFQLAGPPAAVVHQPRRFSKMQAFAFLLVSLVVLIQVSFVFIFPLWQKKEAVPVKIPPKPKVQVKTPAEPRTTNTPMPAVELTSREPVTVPVKPVAPEPPPMVTPPPVEPPRVATPAPEPKPEPLVIPPELTQPVERPPIVREPAGDPLMADARKLLADAQTERRNGNLIQAENLLARAQMLAPEYVPIRRERAQLFEQRGMLTEATEQWQRVEALSSRGSTDRNKASAEQKRIADLLASRKTTQEPVPVRDTPRPTSPTPATPAPVTTTPPPSARPVSGRYLKIVSIDRERFRAQEDYDEMRLLRITLRPHHDAGAISTADVNVVVQFYDRIMGTDRLVPSRALVSTDGLRILGAWPPGEARTVTATYMVKQGFRTQEYALINERRDYEGYRVMVYYRNQLQDEAAMPRSILNLPRPAGP